MLPKGFKHKESTKRQMSESHKGMIFTEEHCHNISIAKKGVGKGIPLKEEHKRKISESCKGELNGFWGHTFGGSCKSCGEFHCGGVHPLEGTHLSEEQKRNLSEHNGMKGHTYGGIPCLLCGDIHVNGMKGKHHKEESKKLMSVKGKGRKQSESQIKNSAIARTGLKRPEKTKQKLSQAQKRLWNDKTYREDQLRKIFHNLTTRPTRPEKRFTSISEKHDLGYLYTGDGSCFIGGCNPDNIHSTLKKIIEINGDYWHKDGQNNDKKRAERFAKYGYDTLFIWEHELNEFSEDEIVKIVREFTMKSHDLKPQNNNLLVEHTNECVK
jgi:G:T-mismatch repair DNA endonuclease (very short patch repair protein)